MITAASRRMPSGPGPASVPPEPEPRPNEADALDAYSRVIVTVVRRDPSSRATDRASPTRPDFDAA